MLNVILNQLSKITQYFTRSRKKVRSNPKTIHNLYKMKNQLSEKRVKPINKVTGNNRIKGKRAHATKSQTEIEYKDNTGNKCEKANKKKDEVPSKPSYTGEKCIRHPYKLRKFIQARKRREGKLK